MIQVLMKAPMLSEGESAHENTQEARWAAGSQHSEALLQGLGHHSSGPGTSLRSQPLQTTLAPHTHAASQTIPQTCHSLLMPQRWCLPWNHFERQGGAKQTDAFTLTGGVRHEANGSLCMEPRAQPSESWGAYDALASLTQTWLSSFGNAALRTTTRSFPGHSRGLKCVLDISRGSKVLAPVG